MRTAATGAATMGVGATGTANMRSSTMERGTMGGAITVAESIWDHRSSSHEISSLGNRRHGRNSHGIRNHVCNLRSSNHSISSDGKQQSQMKQPRKQ
jgi:hypothetical protein